MTIIVLLLIRVIVHEKDEFAADLQVFINLDRIASVIAWLSSDSYTTQFYKCII